MQKEKLAKVCAYKEYRKLACETKERGDDVFKNSAVEIRIEPNQAGLSFRLCPPGGPPLAWATIPVQLPARVRPWVELRYQGSAVILGPCSELTTVEAAAEAEPPPATKWV